MSKANIRQKTLKKSGIFSYYFHIPVPVILISTSINYAHMTKNCQDSRSEVHHQIFEMSNFLMILPQVRTIKHQNWHSFATQI